MEKVEIKNASSNSEIIIGPKWEDSLSSLPEGTIIITDENVKRLYGNKFPSYPVYSVNPGEQSKKLSVVEDLAARMMSDGIDREGFVLAIGGGVVCDLAGFLAAVYMRGLRCGYVSTTLLAQVDASTGGKNGVNLGESKNIIGTFRQPEFVICDPEMLKTLSEEEFLSGLAEVIKTGIIGDEKLFGLIENNTAGIKKRDPELLAELITRSVKFKAAVVSEDETEKGLRRILNFGHTFGHAIELQSGMRHGYAVAEGMILATGFSFEKGLITAAIRQRILALLGSFYPGIKQDIEPAVMEKMVRSDKKKTGNDIYFVFTGGIGKATALKISYAELNGFYRKYTGKN